MKISLIKILISILILFYGVYNLDAAEKLTSQAGADSLRCELPKLDGEALLKAYGNLSFFYRETDFDMSIEYSDKLLHYLQTSRFSELPKAEVDSYAAPIHFNKGYCQKNCGDYLAAIENFHLAAKEYTKEVMLASTYEQIGAAYYYLGHFNDAMHYYRKSLSMLEKSPHDGIYAQLINNIAVVLKLLGNYEEALSYFQQALEIKKGNENIKGQAINYLNIGIVYRELGEDQKSTENYQEALKLAIESDDLLTESQIYNNLGNLYLDQSDFETAELYFKKSLSLKRQIGDEWGIANTLNNIVKLNLNRFDEIDTIKIREVADSALAMSMKVGALQLISQGYNNNYMINVKAGNLQEAFKMKYAHYAYQDSLISIELENDLLEMEALLNHKSRIAQISILEKQNLKKKVQVKRSKVKLSVLIIISILFCVFSLFLLWNYKQKKRMQEKMEIMNSELDRATKQLKKKITELDSFRGSLTANFDKAISDVRNRDNILIIQSRYVALSDMIESISMKWKSNLREIQLQVDLLKSGYHSNQLSPEVLEQIVTNSMKILYDMSDKIDDFRDFFRPQPSAMDFYVRDVVLKSLNFVEDYYLKHNINIFLEETDQKIMVKGYPNELSQVIMNVMNNSLEAFIERKVPQPEIRLKLRREFGRVILEIKDNAGGLEQQFTEDVFDAFVSTKEDTDSCGLGLYIAREIIQTRFKGAISIRNDEGGVLVKIIF